MACCDYFEGRMTLLNLVPHLSTTILNRIENSRANYNLTSPSMTVEIDCHHLELCRINWIISSREGHALSSISSKSALPQGRDHPRSFW